MFSLIDSSTHVLTTAKATLHIRIHASKMLCNKILDKSKNCSNCMEIDCLYSLGKRHVRACVITCEMILPKPRAVKQTSFTHEKLETIFGSLLRVPMSAAIPISTSLTANLASFEQILMSALLDISIARPMDMPCITQITASIY